MLYKSRFAPSPTGLLHIGNARSAVLNWAHIMNKGGEFILRIDDTDEQRSEKQYIDKIKEDLTWIGLNWSKTFNQSSRKKIYQEKITYLKKSKKIYPCFETPEELSLKRKNLLSQGKPPIYDRSSLKLSSSEISSLMSKGKKAHWRFKLNDEMIEWDDLIKGKISIDSKNLSDPILIREDGSLLYHLPSVIDDIEENITDIIRGEDHITNTAFHVLLFKTLGEKIPLFGHHPLLIDDTGKSLGKRLGSLSINQIKEQGFENITIINYLLSIGTSKNLSKEININNAIKNFDINNIGISSPRFSLDTLVSLNKDIIRSYDFINVKPKYLELKLDKVNEQFWNFVKNNINFFNESLDWYNIINSKDIYIKESNDIFKIAADLLPNEPYNLETWNNWIKLIQTKTSKKGKDIFMPIRIALTGKEKGPELKYLIPLLSREHILKKLGNE